MRTTIFAMRSTPLSGHEIGLRGNGAIGPAVTIGESKGMPYIPQTAIFACTPAVVMIYNGVSM
jgi:hypothetical protein